MELPLQGGCRCDRVRIRVTKAPLITAACHCNGCQRMSASAFSLTAVILSEAFEVVQGQPVLGGIRSADTQHFFCDHCMTWMFTRPSALPQIVNVRPSMFDDHTWFRPFMETFTAAKLPWAVTGAVHSFEGFPEQDQYMPLVQEFAASGGAARSE